MVKEITFSVEFSFFLISFDLGICYAFFVSLTNQCNQEVEQNDHEKNLLNKPKEPTKVNHDIANDFVIIF